MRNMSAWAIRHPISPIVLFVVLLFMGIVAFVRLPITLNPDIAFPLVMVTVVQPGAAPTDMETQILQKVEGAVAGIGNIHNITSWAFEGQAQISIEFNIGTPIDRAVADVRDAVAKVRVQLPQGIQEPIVQREDVDGGAIVYYAISTTTVSQQELSWFVDNTITKRLLGGAGRREGRPQRRREPGDPGRARPRAHAGTRPHRRPGQPADPAAQPRFARRPRASRRRRTGDPRTGRSTHRPAARRYPDHVAGQPLRATERHRQRARRHRRSALYLPAQRP